MRWFEGVLLLLSFANVGWAGAADAQDHQLARPAAPAFWLQLRGGVDNAGIVAGSMAVSWNFKAPRPVRGLAVASGHVFIGAESDDAHTMAPSGDQRGYVAAVDVVTGEPQWERWLPSWIHGDPVVFDQTVVVAYGRWPMTHLGGVTALDARSGATVWDHPVRGGVMPSPAVDTLARTVIAAGGDGVLYIIDLTSGKIRNTFGMRAPNGMSSPRIDAEGTVVLSASSTTFSYSTRSGTLNWETRPGFQQLGDIPVALTEEMFYTTGTRKVNAWTAFHALPLRQFRAILTDLYHETGAKTALRLFRQQSLIAGDRRTGRILWEAPLGIGPTVPRNQSGTPVVVGDRVIVSSPVSKMITAFDARSGKRIWERRLLAMHKGAVTVIGTDIILGDRDGVLTVLNLADGAVIARCKASGKFSVTAPVLVGKTLFVVTMDGWVRASSYAQLRRSMANDAHTPPPCFFES